MGRLHTVGFNEDIDLSGGAATIAALKGMINCSLPDADNIKLPNVKGMYLKAIRWHDETAAGTGGYLSFVGYHDERKIRFGKDVLTGDLLTGEIIFPDKTIPLPPSQQIACVGDASGAGAEQHTVLLDIFMPHLPSVKYYNNRPCKNLLLVGKKTGTLTAQTVSGLSNIIKSFEDSEVQLSEDPVRQYALTRLGAFPSAAGYGVLGVRHPDGLSDLLFPAMISAVKGNYYPIGWEFNGESPPLLVGAGVGTTSVEAVLEILAL